MGNNSVPKFIFRLSRFPVCRASVLGRFYCTTITSVIFSQKHKPKQQRLKEMEHDLKLPPKSKWELRPSVLLHSG